MERLGSYEDVSVIYPSQQRIPNLGAVNRNGLADTCGGPISRPFIWIVHQLQQSAYRRIRSRTTEGERHAVADVVVRMVAQPDQSTLATTVSEMAKGEHSRYQDISVLFAVNNLEEGVAAFLWKGARG